MVMKTASRMHHKGPISILSSEIQGMTFEKPSSLVAQIYKALARAIARGELKPGQLLTEVELQKAFNVSRAPIREAIRMLEANEMVVVDAYRKKYVRPIARKYIQDVIPVIVFLEGHAASLACDRLTEKQIRGLKRNCEEMKIAFDQENYELCYELDLDFHRTFIMAADNEALVSALRFTGNSIIWFWWSVLCDENHEIMSVSVREHNGIIQQFIKRDSIKAEAVVRKHVSHVIESSLKFASFDSEGFYMASD